MKQERTMKHLDESERQYDIAFLQTNGFSEKQIIEIQAGLKLGLDVSVYADKKYDPDQMYQVRRGLEEGVDVSIYLNPQYPFNRMSDIRNRLYARKNRERS